MRVTRGGTNPGGTDASIDRVRRGRDAGARGLRARTGAGVRRADGPPGRLRRRGSRVRRAGERPARRVLPGVPLGHQRRHAQHQRRLRPDAPDRRRPHLRARGAGARPRRRGPARRRRAARCPARRPRPTSRRRPPPRCRPSTRAAALTGAAREALRDDPAANIRGGAALLASYQKAPGRARGSASDPAAWYGAVARYSGADSADAAAAFADEVYATIRAGAARTTDDGQRRTAGRPRRSRRSAARLDRLGLRKLARPDGLECPRDRLLRVDPGALRAVRAGPAHYGNHDLSDRPARQKIEYIVIHDTEASWATTLDLVQDPTYVSWHYTLRSVDGHIAQHVKTKDVAWHAGNWYVNAKLDRPRARGLRGRQGTWYTEAMYRTSAKLVRYLALRLRHPARPRSTSSATTTFPARPRRPSPACTGTRARTGTGRTTSTCSARRSGRTGTARTGLVHDRPRLRHQPAGVHRLRRRPACRARRTAPPRSSCAPRRAADAPLVNDLGAAPGRRTVHDAHLRPRRAGLGRADVRGGRAAGRLDGDLVPRPEGAGSPTRARRPPPTGSSAWSRRRSRARPRSRCTGGPTRRPSRLPGRRAGAGDLAAAVHALGRAALRRRRGAAGSSTTGRPRSPARHPATGR